MMDQSSLQAELNDERLYNGVRSRRVMAFLIDYVIVFILCIPAAIVIALLGVLTFGFGWALYAFMFPIVALFYVAITMGGERQATIGMQTMNIRLIRLDGIRIDSLTAIAHSVLFWAFNALLTPLVLLATLFLNHKRALHDLVIGTVFVRSDRLNKFINY